MIDKSSACVENISGFEVSQPRRLYWKSRLVGNVAVVCISQRIWEKLMIAFIPLGNFCLGGVAGTHPEKDSILRAIQPASMAASSFSVFPVHWGEVPGPAGRG